MSALVKPIAGKITVIDIIDPAPRTGGSANEATMAQNCKNNHKIGSDKLIRFNTINKISWAYGDSIILTSRIFKKRSGSICSIYYVRK